MFAPIEESEFFLSHVKPDHKVLEYGSGSSTLEIAKICKSILSIEHDSDWYHRISSSIPLNAKILLRASNLPYVEGTYNCGTYEEFKDYILAPIEYGQFDIILIDGRARMECAKICNLLSHDSTIIFIHDFTSRITTGYSEVFNYLDIIESVGDMSKFKIKNDKTLQPG